MTNNMNQNKDLRKNEELDLISIDKVGREVEVDVVDETQIARTDIEQVLFELDKKIEMLSSHADNIDYFVSIASGILCGMLDILWVGDFDITRGRELSKKQTEGFVLKVAKLLGYKGEDLDGAVKFLEKKFPIPSDGNTKEFGGGLQHHLRDFAHHPTIVGLIFSLLTQFTYYSYGTDTNGTFLVVRVKEESEIFIGKDVPDKIFKGTVIWFFHLISDLVGSNSTAGFSGGTGIPGPITSLIKEISTLPFIKDISNGKNNISFFLSKLFNGTLFAKHDESGKIIRDSIIKIDFRGELGVFNELDRQAIPVVANDCIVRTFYFIRRFAIELRENDVSSLSEINRIKVENIRPFGNPTISRMLLVATGVFTAIDVSEAVITKKYFVSVNYIGVGRFIVAIGEETINYLKVRNVKQLKKMYEKISNSVYKTSDDNIYRRIKDMSEQKLCLNKEQVEILYNIEYYKTLNDIRNSYEPIKTLKSEWLNEWKQYMEMGFSKFLDVENAKLIWYDRIDLLNRISELGCNERWYKLVLLEAMIFEPYFPISVEKNNKGEEIPSKKYDDLKKMFNGFDQYQGDLFLDSVFDLYGEYNFVLRLRDTYKRTLKELRKKIKIKPTNIIVMAASIVAIAVSAGFFAGPIAVALVGSEFAGLSGAALTSACLAYVGGGAIAVGGAGMAGGTVAIVGGGAILGAGAGTIVNAIGGIGKDIAELQSAKLIVSMKEIFLNDEKDIEYSNIILKEYISNLSELEKKIVDLKLKENTANEEEKSKLKKEIEELEEIADTMGLAMKSMNRFKSAFELGINDEFDDD